jgi:hypothetical protein
MPAPTARPSSRCPSALSTIVLAATLAFATAAVAHPTAPRAADPRVQREASELNGELLRGLQDLERSAPAAREAHAKRVREIAVRRAASLKALAAQDPAAAMLQTLPYELRRRLPASAAGAVEQEVDATGIVVGRIAENFDTHQARQDFFLEVPDRGRTRRLNLARADRSLGDEEMLRLVGRRMKVRGMLLDDELIVAERRNVRDAGDGSTGTGSTTTTTTTPATTGTTPTTAPNATTPTTSVLVSGEQQTLVIMGHFTDKANACSSSTLASSLFSSSGSSMDGLFRETSRNNVSFTGKVIGPFSIPFSAGAACDYTAWGQALDAAAAAAGHSLSGYKRISYSVPVNPSCGWSGLAYLGGSRSWVNSCNPGVFVHELGHNLRFHHASAGSAEYGDGSDPMGGARMVQFNAANRVMAGWQPTGTLQDVIGSSSFSLSSLSLTGLYMPQVLRIRKADTSEYYYVSVRSGSGYDLNLGTYAGRVTVHRASGTLPSKTWLLAQLGAGQTYTDAVNGISITPGTVDAISGSATVAVAMTSSACAPAAPSVAVSPVSQSGSPGQARTYGVTVTNKDSSACAASSFTLAQALPSGFSGGFSAPSVTLVPGGSTSLNWTVASPSNAAQAAYTITASASRTAGSASASATYLVYADSSAPTVSFVAPAYGAVLRRGSIGVSASATDPNGVARVDFYANGQLIGSRSSAPYTVTWNARRAARGSYTLTARATDTAGNVGEASIPVTLQ